MLLKLHGTVTGLFGNMNVNGFGVLKICWCSFLLCAGQLAS